MRADMISERPPPGFYDKRRKVTTRNKVIFFRRSKLQTQSQSQSQDTTNTDSKTQEEGHNK